MSLTTARIISSAILVLSSTCIFGQSSTSEAILIKRELDFLDSKLSAYASRNPVRTLAVAVTFGGIYKALSSSVSDNEAGATAIAAGYCMLNFDDCAEAASYLGPLLKSKIEYQSRLNQLTSNAQSRGSSSSERWEPGRAYPGLHGVVYGQSPGTLQPAAGFRWMNPDDPNDKRVIETVVIGIGVEWEINQEFKRPQVLRIIPGSSANDAGLWRGIIITKVDGIPTENRSSSDIANLIRGNAGTRVHLEFWNPIDKVNYQVALTRRAFNP